MLPDLKQVFLHLTQRESPDSTEHFNELCEELVQVVSLLSDQDELMQELPKWMIQTVTRQINNFIFPKTIFYDCLLIAGNMLVSDGTAHECWKCLQEINIETILYNILATKNQSNWELLQAGCPASHTTTHTARRPVAYTVGCPVAYTVGRPVAYTVGRPVAYTATHTTEYPESLITVD